MIRNISFYAKNIIWNGIYHEWFGEKMKVYHSISELQFYPGWAICYQVYASGWLKGIPIPHFVYLHNGAEE